MNIHSAPLPLPNKVQINSTDISSKQLLFNWSPVVQNCPSLHYNILSSNCGNCLTTTTNTTVICTDVPTDRGGVCLFAIQTVVCGDIVGNRSTSVNTFFISYTYSKILFKLCIQDLISRFNRIYSYNTSLTVQA